jgi:hypothetical protein
MEINERIDRKIKSGFKGITAFLKTGTDFFIVISALGTAKSRADYTQSKTQDKFN